MLTLRTLCAAAALAAGATALDNGLALTPPLGWRSWNCFKGDISDDKIRAQIAALTKKRPSVRTVRSASGDDGTTTQPASLSLLDIGYSHAGIDGASPARAAPAPAKGRRPPSPARPHGLTCAPTA
eukprot:SAG22_NODE_418_length_10750_cov_11.722280_7_plen_126_part_00